VAALLAASILIYNAWLKQTPVGPLAMGGCRMLNVLLGMNAADLPLHAEHWLVAGGIGVYVAGVTWFARREAAQSSRLQLALATAVMVLGIALLAWFPSWSDRTILRVQFDPQHWRLLVGILGVLILWRCLWAVIDPAPARVRMAVAQCVLSLVMLDAVACFAIQDVFWAGMILTLLLPAMFFGHWIETT
jgi:4-hydroxybenzoate polyprenyltransferase